MRQKQGKVLRRCIMSPPNKVVVAGAHTCPTLAPLPEAASHGAADESDRPSRSPSLRWHDQLQPHSVREHVGASRVWPGQPPDPSRARWCELVCLGPCHVMHPPSSAMSMSRSLRLDQCQPCQGNVHEHHRVHCKRLAPATTEGPAGAGSVSSGPVDGLQASRVPMACAGQSL